MKTHQPPIRKQEVKMSRLDLSLAFKHAIAVVLLLDIPQSIKEQIKNALELALQDIMKNSKP